MNHNGGAGQEAIVGKDLIESISLPDDAGPGPSLKEKWDTEGFFGIKKRRGWTSSDPRCNMEKHTKVTRKAGIWYVSIWERTVTGRTFTEIKEDPAEAERFAGETAEILKGMLGLEGGKDTWAIVTTPKRRHTGWHFATEVCRRVSELTGIRFYEDAAREKNRGRIGAEFEILRIPEEPNVIIFDDIATTGSTIKAMTEPLRGSGKNTFCVIGIHNKNLKCKNRT